MVSIVIRTKNEERWITQCLNGLFSQNYKDFEVIIVDNESDDKTIEKVKQFNVKKILSCRNYLPGKALNMGIRESGGDFIVCLSGHCIPVDNKWLENLLNSFDDPSVAGAYGRQEAMSFTSNADKRDLALVFGLDKKIQTKDSFFHNANSMIRKDVWNQIPFDETVTNIEDRVWAQKVLASGYKIIYEPEARVYHYHGIHQNGNEERCTNVVKIMEHLRGADAYKTIDAAKLNVVAVIPVKGEIRYLDDKPLIYYTIQSALDSKCIKRIIVSTDNPELVELSRKLGAEAPFIRDPLLSEEYVDLSKVLRYSLSKIEELKIFPDLVVPLEVTFPFRPNGLLDKMILHLTEKGFDSVKAVKRENRAIWKEQGGKITQVEEGLTPRQFKEPTFVELTGLGYVTHPEFLRGSDLEERNIGIYEVDNPYSHLEVRNEEDFKMASPLLKEWFK